MATLKAQELFEVNGLVAFITGGGTGLGSYMALALAKNGARKVYIFGRRKERLEGIAEKYPDVIVPIPGNVDSKEDLLRAADIVRSEIGFINLVVANAGTGDKPMLTLGPDPTLEQLQEFALSLTEEDWWKTLNTNLTGSFFTVAAFLDLLKAGNEAKNVPYSSQVIAVTSAAAFRRAMPPGGFAYLSSKAAITHLFKMLSTIMLPYKIRSNIICPGLYDTEMTPMLIAAVTRPDGTLSLVPEGRAGDDKDMAAVILFLASRAGAFCNGHVTLTDGGSISNSPATY